MSDETTLVVPYSRAEERALPVVRQADPMAMIAHAVQEGMSPETIKALLDLRDRMEANEARKAFVVALNEFKANPPEIFKNKQVSFGAGKTAYKHATLDNVSGVIGAALAKVGISHRWETLQLDGGIVRVTCVLQHLAGHQERVPLQASPDTSGSKNSIQAVGSVVTYLQRYTLLAATGMAVRDTDDDGRAGKGNAMPEKALADWLTAIEMVETNEQAEALWRQILDASKSFGDIDSHEVLRAKMLSRRRELKEISK